MKMAERFSAVTTLPESVEVALAREKIPGVDGMETTLRFEAESAQVALDVLEGLLDRVKLHLKKEAKVE